MLQDTNSVLGILSGLVYIVTWSSVLFVSLIEALGSPSIYIFPPLAVSFSLIGVSAQVLVLRLNSLW